MVYNRLIFQFPVYSGLIGSSCRDYEPGGCFEIRSAGQSLYSPRGSTDDAIRYKYSGSLGENLAVFGKIIKHSLAFEKLLAHIFSRNEKAMGTSIFHECSRALHLQYLASDYKQVVKLPRDDVYHQDAAEVLLVCRADRCGRAPFAPHHVTMLCFAEVVSLLQNLLIMEGDMSCLPSVLFG